MKTFFDEELERKILGQIIVDSNSFITVAEILDASDFYVNEHRQVFEILEMMFKDNIVIDIITLNNYCFKHKIQILSSTLAGYCEGIITASHVSYHAKIVKDFSIRRNLLVDLSSLIKSGSDPSLDLDEFISQAGSFTDKILGTIGQSSKINTFKENVNEAIKQIQERQDKKNNIKYGVPVSSYKLRLKIPMWENSDLIIIAGRPSMGKTAIALYEAFHIARNYGPIIFFSLEMDEIKLTKRLMQAESGLSRYDFESMSRQAWDQLDSCLSSFIDIPFFIDPTPAASLSHIRVKTKIFKKQHDLKAIFVDYLQLMKAMNGQNRERQVADISAGLKSIAKEFKIPVFLLAQLNRGPEARREEMFKPKLSDLRESGAIEQDADIVIFPFRPAYYYPNEIEFKYVCELIVAKNRNGEVGTVSLFTNETKTRFFDENPGL